MLTCGLPHIQAKKPTASATCRQCVFVTEMSFFALIDTVFFLCVFEDLHLMLILIDAH